MKKGHLVTLVNVLEGDDPNAIYQILDIDIERNYILVKWVNSGFNLAPIFNYFSPMDFKIVENTYCN